LTFDLLSLYIIRIRIPHAYTQTHTWTHAWMVRSLPRNFLSQPLVYNKYTPNESLETFFNKFLGLFNSSTYNNLLFKQQSFRSNNWIKRFKRIIINKTHCYRYLNELSQRYHICKNVSSNFRHKVYIYLSNC